MIVTVSAGCERLPTRARRPRRGAPYTSPPPPGHPRTAARTSPPRPGFSKPPFPVPGAVLGVSPGPPPEPGVSLTLAYCTVDNFAGNVDGEAAENFFPRTGRGRHQCR